MGGKSKGPSEAEKAAKAAEKAAKAAEKAAKAFFKAAKEGDRSKVEAPILAGTVDVNYMNEKGQTAAHMAAAFGHKKLLQFLHKHGARFDLETNDHHKFTPLRAAEFVGEKETAKFIEELLAGTAAEMGDEDSDEGTDDDEDEDGGQGNASASGQLVSKSAKGRGKRSVPPPEGGSASSAGGPCRPPEVAEPALAVDTAPLIAERQEDIQKSESDNRRCAPFACMNAPSCYHLTPPLPPSLSLFSLYMRTWQVPLAATHQRHASDAHQ